MTIHEQLSRIIELLEAIQPKPTRKYTITQRTIPAFEQDAKLREWAATASLGFHSNQKIAEACGIPKEKTSVMAMCRVLDGLGIRRAKTGPTRGFKIGPQR